MSQINTKKESFEWCRIPPECDRRFVFKVVASQATETDHTKDKSIPVSERKIRVYSKEERKIAARSLALRHIDINHDLSKIIPNAIVLDAQFIEPDKIECICYIPDEKVIADIRAGLYKNVSIEEMNREDVPIDDNRVDVRGITYFGLALVGKPFKAGDLLTSISPMFESVLSISKLEFLVEGADLAVVNEDKELIPLPKDKEVDGKLVFNEITKNDIKEEEKLKGEPFAGFTNFADCVSKNQDKDNPDGYCASIMRAVEGKTLEEAKLIVAKLPFTLKKGEAAVIIPDKPKTPEPLKPEERIKELEEAVGRLSKLSEELKTTQAAKIKEAKEETKKAIIDKVSKVIPATYVQRQVTQSTIKFITDLKKVLKEVSE